MEIENWTQAYRIMKRKEKHQKRQLRIWRTAFIVETVAVVLIGLAVLVR